MPALIILRFIAGFFSAPPLANAGGSLNDIGNPIFRTLALPICTSMGFVGPILGPIIGSFVAESRLGWRWCYWVTAIWNGASFLMVVVFMPETLGGALLKYKAIAWRKEEERRRVGTGEKDGSGNGNGTGDSPKEMETGIWRAEVEDESLVIALVRSLKRPFKMLIKEPILVFFSIYLTGEFPMLCSLCSMSVP
jgi:DHA1 family multidrug resistance protein-like MFS transporter